jgi:hypothetical protein
MKPILTYKNSKDLIQAHQRDQAAAHRLVILAADRIQKYVFSSGGLEKSGKVWDYVANEPASALKEALISILTDSDEFMPLKNYKKPDLNLELLKTRSIHKNKMTGSFWQKLWREPRMSYFESQLVMIDPRTGNVIQPPKRFDAPPTPSTSEASEDFEKFETALNAIALFLMS